MTDPSPTKKLIGLPFLGRGKLESRSLAVVRSDVALLAQPSLQLRSRQTPRLINRRFTRLIIPLEHIA